MEWSQLANALLPAPGMLASFWHSKGLTGSFLFWLSWLMLCAVPSRLQLLMLRNIRTRKTRKTRKTRTLRSIKAETCKTIHRPQYLSTKKKDTAECPHMGGEAVEAFREAGEASLSLACTLKQLSACTQRPEHRSGTNLFTWI